MKCLLVRIVGHSKRLPGVGLRRDDFSKSTIDALPPRKRSSQSETVLMSLPYYRDWTKATEDAVAQLTAVTGDAGNLWPYPISALPAGIAANMPELENVFISGYVKPQVLPNGLEAIGELLVTRAHDVPASGKAYMYLVGVGKENDVYFRGHYKPFPEHYYNVDHGIPVNQLFGRIILSNLDQKNI
jgi:hypothetical protein